MTRPDSELVTVLSLGAGVQSSTLALLAMKGKVKPMPNFAVFADTGAEPKKVYEWLDWLTVQLPFPVHTVQWREGLTPRELSVVRSKNTGKLYRSAAAPFFLKKENGGVGMLRRCCTMDYKINPIIRKIRKEAQIKRGEKEVKVVQWLGISRDEAIRMKPSSVPFIKNEWPLIDLDMTREDCKNWMAESNYPEPPRSACIYCPYHSNKEWANLKTSEDWPLIVQFEKDIQEANTRDEVITSVPYLHSSCIPIDLVKFEEEKGQMNLWGNECEGMCGI